MKINYITNVQEQTPCPFPLFFHACASRLREKTCVASLCYFTSKIKKKGTIYPLSVVLLTLNFHEI